MKRYIRRNAIINAVQVPSIGYPLSYELEELVKTQGWRIFDDHIEITSASGNTRAGPLDWIICGSPGNYYPCEAAAFHRMYVPA